MTVPGAAAHYDQLWREAYGDMQDVGPVHFHMRRLVARMLAPLPYDSVLDVGCGAGHNLPLLCADRRLDRVAGVDLSGEALRRARERSAASFSELDVEIAHLDERWELVFSALVLEHLADDGAALRNMRAMCGRWLAVVTIAGDFERYRPWEEQVGHVRNYRRGELEAKLERAGFRVRESVYWGFPFYTPVVRTLQNRMAPKPEFGTPTRIAARALQALYRLNSSRRGDLLIAVAEAV
ncbi:MAG TPA: class I SAM-dependent methyltransferase [Solirubrobacteraceae bacterium]|jgi:SAM-dependent methyltransferase